MPNLAVKGLGGQWVGQLVTPSGGGYPQLMDEAAVTRLRGLVIFALCSALAAPAAAAAPDGTLVVRVWGLRNDRGLAWVALFRSAEGYPGRADKVFRRASVRVKRGRAVALFRGLPAGDYAAAVIHDENKNGKLDTNWLGIPKEGIGASNNATRMFGAPKYAKARFVFSGLTSAIKLKMRYYF